MWARPIAYSYARFSTPQQERGDSERRQIEAARQYAEQHRFILDESVVVDRGVSAFAGKNVSEGALGEFIKRVEREKIARGSALFVDHQKRLGAVWGQKKHYSPAGIAITNKLPG